MELIITYLHFIGIMVLFTALFVQHMLVKPQISLDAFKSILFFNKIFGLSALIVIVTGLLKVFAVGKPALYYAQNWIFHLKFGVFILVGLLSIVPTVFFKKQEKTPEVITIEVPGNIINIIRLEFLIICILPLLATLIARGVGAIAQ